MESKAKRFVAVKLPCLHDNQVGRGRRQSRGHNWLRYGNRSGKCNSFPKFPPDKDWHRHLPECGNRTNKKENEGVEKYTCLNKRSELLPHVILPYRPSFSAETGSRNRITSSAVLAAALVATVLSVSTFGARLFTAVQRPSAGRPIRMEVFPQIKERGGGGRKERARYH